MTATYAYFNNGLSLRAVDAGYVTQSGEAVFQGLATSDQLTAAFPGYAAAAAARSAVASAQSLIAAGIPIASTSGGWTSTFTIDANSKADIDGIYAGIKNGDGLPGGGSSFNYPDITGTMREFTEATFPEFAKAVRDYLYQIGQGQTPTTPVTIA